MKTRAELFILKDEQGPILYAPFGDKIARINEAAQHAVAKFLEDEALDEEEQAVIQMLEDHGFFVAEPAIPPEEPFAPTHVTLFPSNGCNLRCRYCYAAAEEVKETMNVEVGKAAIDFVAANAEKNGQPGFSLGFHGNGEPFTASKKVAELCRYAQAVAQEKDLALTTSVATNGVMNADQQDFLLANFSNANISFDGLPELQDRQRPFADGSGSSAQVDETLRRLDASGREYGIRSTLTAQTVDRLPDIVDYVKEHYPNCKQLHIEPAWESGRCVDTGEQTPLEDAFIAAFIEGTRRIGNDGMSLVFSGARQDLVANSFCAVNSGGFTITVDGKVTACYEVCTEGDERHRRYYYGEYDPGQKTFVFDEEKMAELSRLKVENMPYCNDCFCRWHCAGDCVAKVLGLKDPADHAGSPRCKITRALTFNQIQRKLGTQEVNVHG